MSERNPAYPAHAPDIHEDEDEDDKPLVRPASRNEPAEERRDLATDDEDFPPLVPPRQPSAAPVIKKKISSMEGSNCFLEQEVSRDSCERAEDASILGRKSECEALRNIISKSSEERNLRDLHLEHYHTSTLAYLMTSINTCEGMPFCNSVKPRLERSRVSGLGAEEFGDLIMDRPRMERIPLDF